ncbi:MAG: M48 family metalloprotease [Desulfovibrio sp.]|jgi:putative metalloprotease|nr:M48 family metalloprotease [Desulfovibrio sp.]
MKYLALCLVCVFLFVGCRLSDPGAAVDAAGDAYKAATLSNEDARLLASKASAAYDNQNKRIIAGPGSKYDKRLRALVASLGNEGGQQFNFKVYMSSQVNAFAMADGTIRVFSGLMDLMNDNELLFVIGHEIGHVVDGDTLDKLRVAYAASAARKGAGAVSGTGTAGAVINALPQSELGALAEQVINAQFSQSQESDADKYGLNLLKKLNKDIKAAVTALRKLAGGSGGGSSILSSHPDPNARADKMEELR